MASLTKTVQTELKAITNVAANGQSISSVFDADSRIAGNIFIDCSPEATNTNGTEFRIETSQKASGNDTWVLYRSIISTIATVNSSAPDATEPIGETVIAEATTTNLASGQIVFFKNATLGNSEWGRIVAFTASTSFTLLDGLTYEQSATSTWYNRGERFIIPVDFTSVRRIRVVCNNNYVNAGGVAMNWRAALITCDSIA